MCYRFAGLELLTADWVGVLVTIFLGLAAVYYARQANHLAESVREEGRRLAKADADEVLRRSHLRQRRQYYLVETRLRFFLGGWRMAHRALEAALREPMTVFTLHAISEMLITYGEKLVDPGDWLSDVDEDTMERYAALKVKVDYVVHHACTYVDRCKQLDDEDIVEHNPLEGLRKMCTDIEVSTELARALRSEVSEIRKAAVGS